MGRPEVVIDKGDSLLIRFPLLLCRKGLFGRSLLVAGLLLACGLAASWIVAGKLVARNARSTIEAPADVPVLPFSLDSDSGVTISGWHLPVKDSQGVIVLLHPMRGSRLSMLERARMFHEARYSSVLVDLQAHGESPGEHITLGHLEQHDVRAAVEFAREQHPDEPIGVLGISLGGASALLASPLNIDALVIESVYSNINAAVHQRVSAQLGVFSTIPADILLFQLKPRLGISLSQLRPIDHLPNVGCPVFVISGKDDQHTTAEETRQMYASAKEPKELWLVNNAAHEDLLNCSETDYKRKVLNFFDRQLKTPH